MGHMTDEQHIQSHATGPDIFSRGDHQAAHHPFWHTVGLVSVCLSFQQVVARFSKCTPQNDGSNSTSSFQPFHLHNTTLHVSPDSER